MQRQSQDFLVQHLQFSIMWPHLISQMPHFLPLFLSHSTCGRVAFLWTCYVASGPRVGVWKRFWIQGNRNLWCFSLSPMTENKKKWAVKRFQRFCSQLKNKVIWHEDLNLWGMGSPWMYWHGTVRIISLNKTEISKWHQDTSGSKVAYVWKVEIKTHGTIWLKSKMKFVTITHESIVGILSDTFSL